MSAVIDSPRNNVEAVCKTIDSKDMRLRMEQALPDGVSVERFVRVVLTAVQQEPSLADADKPSLFNACINAAKDGLLPDKREGALVVFNTKEKRDGKDVWVKKVQWMPMVAGVIKRMGEAGIQAYASSVHRNDRVRLWNDAEGQHIEHDFDAFGERGEFVGVYAVAQLKDGRRYIEHMNLDELERARAASKAPDSGPWASWPDRMAQKSVLHRLGRRVPITIGDDKGERLASTLKREEEFVAERVVHSDVERLPLGKPETRAPKAIVRDDVPDPEPRVLLSRCADLESVREFIAMLERGDFGDLSQQEFDDLASAAAERAVEIGEG